MRRTCQSLRSWFLAGPAVVFALSLLLTAAAQTQRTLRNVKLNEKVPAFSVVDPVGKTISSEAFEGKVLLLLFVRPKHPRSLEVLQVVDGLHGKYSKRTDLATLVVSTKPGTEDYFQDLVDQHDLSLGIAMDPKRKMYGDFGLIVSPTTLLIDKKGVLRYGIPRRPLGYERTLSIHLDLLLGLITQKKHDEQLSGEIPERSAKKDSVKTQLAFAEALIAEGQYEIALSTLSRLRSTSGDSIETDTLLGMLHLKRGMDTEAAKCLDPHATDPTTPAKYKRVYARLQVHRGELPRAEALFLAALTTSSERSALLYELGLLYERMGKPDKALERYRQSLEGIFGSDP